ncbi:ribonuclease R [Halopseudomonas oceani]|uniref:Ribonuclease R n=1 Tax=Halopseudomonas oceani TaxID=1708783 RepID=A0A2P4EXV2_9GAMM|nr:ribonuclease R [Halopseudomonas oceani]POB05051.1 ribonuclease R [Halopseudomonas oceani]
MTKKTKSPGSTSRSTTSNASPDLDLTKDWSHLDPEARREAEKYDNPIPSRELILHLLESRGAPATRAQLQQEFGLSDEESVEALRRRLRAMERDGQVIYTRRGAYAPVDKLDLIPGRIQGHRDGFGFLIPDDNSGDIFLGPSQMRLVFDGDRALARITGVDRRGRNEGAVVEVISRAHDILVGRYYEENGIGYVVADNARINQDVLIAPSAKGGVKHGQYAEVRITQWPTMSRQAQGEVIEVVGDYMAPGMEIEVALRSYDIPSEWPEAVLKEAAKLKDHVVEKDKQKRVDLRHLPLVTIDGEDARDFDDAIYCEPHKASGWRLFSGGWKLYVAIADVSHYVPLGSALDEEAELRGTSVYFPSQVIPMLPEELSNGLCSLNPHVDRLAMVCEMTVSKSGELTDFEFYEAVIHSHARLTYNKVSSMLEHPRSREGKALRDEYSEVVAHLENLYELYKALAKARQGRGAIDFETTETRMVFGDDRKIVEIKPTTRNDAHKIVEECMLCANVATARFLQELELPGLYRVHDSPQAEKIERLREFLNSLGLSLTRKKGDPTPEDYAAVLARVQGRPDAQLIQTVMLRSLSQAVYSPDNAGHFGLNYEAYTHFTSPIRRYPDLLVHRAIRSVIRSRRNTDRVRRAGAGVIPKAKIYPYDHQRLTELGEQCSQNERRADEATRDVVSWLKCEFMQDRVGESFDGLVTAVTGFGLFIELTDIYVEGLLHITALPADYYEFDAVHHSLIGERSGRRFRLGDSVRVQVARVDLDDRKIDFEMAQDKPQPAAERQVSASRAMREKLLADARRAAGETGSSGKSNRKGRSDGSAGKSPAVSRDKTSRSSKPSGGSKSGGKKAAPADASANRGPRKRKAR